jgi:hypothetical protein
MYEFASNISIKNINAQLHCKYFDFSNWTDVSSIIIPSKSDFLIYGTSALLKFEIRSENS